jgi:hypothetical protein
MPIDPTLITSALASWQPPPAFDPISQIAKIQALKNGFAQSQLQQQQLQTGALELQKRQQDFQDQQALDAAWKGAITTDPNTGAITYDRSKVLSNVPGHLAPGIQQTLTGMDEAKAKLDKAQADAVSARNELFADPLLYVKDQGYAPAALDAALTHAVGTGSIPAAQALQWKQQLGPNPTPADVQRIVDPLLSTPGIQKVITERQTAQANVTRADAAKQTAELAKEKERVAQVEKAKQALGAAASQDDLNAGIKNLIAAGATPGEVNQVPQMFSPQAMTAYNRGLLSSEQRTTADREAAKEAALEADRKVTQAQNARRIAIEGQNAAINAKKFAMEFGGDAVQGWAQQVASNPDTANQVPPALRTPVMAAFTAKTGLPFPKPLTGTAVDQERASRNALDAVKQIQEALKDPAIQSRVGPILGRLGNAEQTAGTAIGLTPEQEAKAQQLRTNMRYLVFQEGKALMGGRIPQQLMTQLEQSSPNVAMDAGTLNGALAGVTDAAGRNLDQTFKQRFGENAARPRAAAPAAAAVPPEVRAALAAEGPGIHKLSDGSKWLKAADGTITKQ